MNFNLFLLYPYLLFVSLYMCIGDASCWSIYENEHLCLHFLFTCTYNSKHTTMCKTYSNLKVLLKAQEHGLDKKEKNQSIPKILNNCMIKHKGIMCKF